MWRMEGGRSGGVASVVEGSRGAGRSCKGGAMEGGDVAAIAAGGDARNEPPAAAEPRPPAACNGM